MTTLLVDLCRDVAPPARHIALVGLAAVVCLACTPSEAVCDCVTPGIAISAPSGTVQTLSLGGTACTGGKVQCTSMVLTTFVPGCTDYQVDAVRPGDCQVNIVLADGTNVKKTFSIVQTTGCCAGLYPADYNGYIVVSAADDGGASMDAAADGG